MKRICTFNYLAIDVLVIKVILDIIINYVVLKNMCKTLLFPEHDTQIGKTVCGTICIRYYSQATASRSYARRGMPASDLKRSRRG